MPFDSTEYLGNIDVIVHYCAEYVLYSSLMLINSSLFCMSLDVEFFCQLWSSSVNVVVTQTIADVAVFVVNVRQLWNSSVNVAVTQTIADVVVPSVLVGPADIAVGGDWWVSNFDCVGVFNTELLVFQLTLNRPYPRRRRRQPHPTPFRHCNRAMH